MHVPGTGSDAAADSGDAQRQLSAALVAAVAVLAIHNFALRPWMLDDAFISFRYAENLAAGHGVVFNAGERVEGYTNFLWVVLLAGGKRLGLDIVPLSQWLGLLFSLATLGLVSRAHRFIPDFDARTSAVATLFLGTCGAFTPWVRSGMETAMFTFWVALALLLRLSMRGAPTSPRRAVGLGVVVALAALTRPEGVLIAAILGLDVVLRPAPDRRRLLLGMLLPFVALYVPYFIWRWSYYGYPAPNTFYAKVGSSSEQIGHGLRYAVHFAIVAVGLGAVSVYGLATGRWQRRFHRAALLPAAFAIYSTYLILVGGDSMPAYRFFTPLVPALCLTAAMSLTALERGTRTQRMLVVAVVLFGIGSMWIDPKIHRQIVRDKVAALGAEVGLWLRDNAPPGAQLATNTAGSIPYYSRLPVIDMLGLNDVHIAHRNVRAAHQGAGHEKGDGLYVLERDPDYIQFGSSLGAADPVFLSDKEIAAAPRFHARYALATHTLPSGRKLLLYEKRTSDAGPRQPAR